MNKHYNNIQEAKQDAQAAMQLLISKPKQGLVALEEAYVYIFYHAPEDSIPLLSSLLSFFSRQRTIPPKAKRFLQDAKQLLDMFPQHSHSPYLLLNIAVCSFIIGKYDKAVEECKQAILLAEKAAIPMFTFYQVGAQLFFELEKYEEGWIALFKAEELTIQASQNISTRYAEREDFRRWITIFHIHISTLSVSLFTRFKDYHTATLYAEYILHIPDVQEYKIQFAYFLYEYCILLLEQGENLLAEKYLQNLLTIYNETKIHLLGILGYVGLAKASIQTNNPPLALSYAKKALSYGNKISDKLYRLKALFVVAEAYLLQSEYDTVELDSIWVSLSTTLDAIPVERYKTDYYYISARIAYARNNAQQLLTYSQLLLNNQPEIVLDILRGRLFHAKSQQKSFFLDYIKQHPKKMTAGVSATTQQPVAHAAFDQEALLHSTHNILQTIQERIDVLDRFSLQKELLSLDTSIGNKPTNLTLQEIEQEIMNTNKDFLHLLTQQFPLLSHTELRICMFLRMNFSTEHIASLLRISPTTIFTHRKKIRKKLGLDRSTPLHVFLLSLNTESTTE